MTRGRCLARRVRFSLGDEFCLRTPRGGRWRSLARNAPPPTAAALAPARSACSRPGAACAHACAGNVVGDGNSREKTRQKNKACRRAARLPGRGRGSRRKRREHGGGGSPGPWAPPGRPRSAVTGSRLRDSSGPNGKRRRPCEAAGTEWPARHGHRGLSRRLPLTGSSDGPRRPRGLHLHAAWSRACDNAVPLGGGGMIRRDDEDESQSPNRLTEVEPAASTRL